MYLSILSFLSFTVAVKGGGVLTADDGSIRARKLTSHEVGLALLERTHLPQESIGDGGAEGEYYDDEGNHFHTTATVLKTTDNRIRIHDDFKEEILEVECFPASGPEDRAKILLTLREAIEPQDLHAIFPATSLVIIEGEDYGHCDLGFSMSESNIKELKEIADDAYLLLEEVELSSDNLEVSLVGVASNFFAQFEEIELDISLVDDDDNKRRDLEGKDVENDTALHRELVSKNDMRRKNANAMNGMKNSKITPSGIVNCGSGQRKFRKSFDLSDWCAHATSETCINASGSGFSNFHISAGIQSRWRKRWVKKRWGGYWTAWVETKPYFDLSIVTTTQFKTESAVKMSFQNCRKTAEKTIPITDQILLMSLNINAAITAVDWAFGGHKMPKYGIGIYAHIDFVMSGTMELRNKPVVTAGLGYDFGRQRNRYGITMSKSSHRIVNTNQVLDYEAGRGTYTIFEQKGDKMEMDASIFMGLRPAIGLYGKSFQIKLTLDFGLEGELKFRGPKAAKLPAKSSCGDNCNQLCQSPHSKQINLALKAKDLAISFNVYLDFISGQSWDNKSLSKRMDILKGTFLNIPLGSLCYRINDRIAEGRGDASAVSRSFAVRNDDTTNSNFSSLSSDEFFDERINNVDKYTAKVDIINELDILYEELNAMMNNNEIQITTSGDEDYSL